jgi:glycosyltransferase involved in cell wall biosynthesis
LQEKVFSGRSPGSARLHHNEMTIAKLVSLVVATRDRTAELGRLLQSIAEQTHPHIEAIIVDQNRDNRLQPILGLLPTSRLRYLRAEPGLSHARNIGVANARGEVVGFPDDD